MDTTYATLADVPNIAVFRKGNDLLVRDANSVAWVLPDPSGYPADLRKTVEARNVASVTGHCPACSEGSANDYDPRLPIMHADDCPAADANLNVAMAELRGVGVDQVVAERARTDRRFRETMEALPDAPEFVTGAHRTATPKVGRNEPCPCGSGKKFKRCCG